jgi:hypothetical protein
MTKENTPTPRASAGGGRTNLAGRAVMSSSCLPTMGPRAAPIPGLLRSSRPKSAMPKAAARTFPRRDVRSITPESYRSDPLFPRIERAVLAILASSKVVAPVDVLVGMGALRAQHLEAWWFGRVPFLEKVILGNLSKLRRFLRILGFYCHDLNLTASSTAYMRWGKGSRLPLRFTKTGEAKLEALYGRHFVWPGKRPFHLPARLRGEDALAVLDVKEQRNVERRTALRDLTQLTEELGGYERELE